MTATRKLAGIDEQVSAAVGLAARLFDDLRANTRRGDGIWRDAYGGGENYAHDLVSSAASGIGLEVTRDAAANTYLTLPGRDRAAPAVVVGSHLDSVPDGGNFDGAAGVLAGLVAAAALRAAGHTPACDIAIMAVRAEESPWFSTSYFGSRAALGTLCDGILDRLTRADTGRTLAEHVAACGGDPEALRHGPPHLTRKSVRAFLEVHIEQGPVLEGEGCPIGLVTGVRGNFRFPRARIHGAYQHCGATPRRYRRDAVVAAAEFVAALQALWDAWEADGRDMAFTVGRLFTDAGHHAMTKVPGLVEFSLDVRSIEPGVLEDLERRVNSIMAEVAARRGVRFEVGPITHAAVGHVEPSILEHLARGAAALGIRAHHLPSGAAHDAAAFADAGIPSGMVFIRNANGSHNPQEWMEMDDFREATRLLTRWLAETTA